MNRHDEPEIRFTFARVAHIAALLVMGGAIVNALKPFVGPFVGIAVGGVLVYVFGRLVHLVISPEAMPWWQRVLAVAGAVVVGVTTSGLNYAAVYDKFFAKQSAIRESSALREHAEREVGRVLTTARSAQASLQAWAQDASTKAKTESSQGKEGGGTCSSRPMTLGARGPISFWRTDDATIAQSLAGELKSLVDVVEAGTQQLAALSRPTTLDDVRLTLDAMNRVVDAAAPLAGGSAFASQAISMLRQRSASLIEMPGGERVACGDAARLAHIDRAIEALSVLAQASPMSRLALTIDPGDAQDTVTRGWLRGFNGALAMVTWGVAGQFKDDPLMLDQLKLGVLNRETLGFVLALIAEACVVATALTLQREGPVPIRAGFPDWVRSIQRSESATTAHRLLSLAAAALTNLFYSARQDGPTEARRNFVMPPDIVFPEREASYGGELTRWQVTWGDRDYIVIPLVPATRRARAMAHALRVRGVLQCLSSTADAEDLSVRSDFPSRMEAELGPAWSKASYEVFAVKPSYSQVLYNSAIGELPRPALMGARGKIEEEETVPRVRHVPLARKLLARGAGSRL